MRNAVVPRRTLAVLFVLIVVSVAVCPLVANAAPTPFWSPHTPAPIILGVAPESGPTSASTALVIQGFFFTSPMTVRLGEHSLSGVQVPSSMTIRATVPAGLTPGRYDLTVCNASRQCDTRDDAYLVTGAGPVLSEIAPERGYNDQPTEVFVRGRNFSSTVTVSIGTRSLSDLERLDSRTLRGTVPAGLEPGTYDVVALDTSTSLSNTLVAAFTVLDSETQPAPVVANVIPRSGRADAGTRIAVWGMHFAGTPAVVLGSTALEDVEVAGPWLLRATVPSGMTPGQYALTVTNPDGQAGTLADAFTVLGTGPVLQGIQPGRGFDDVDTAVVLHGLNFSAAVSVTVGTQPLADLHLISSRTLTGVVPKGLAAGAYDVMAIDTTTALSSTLRGAFTVVARSAAAEWPVVSDVRPDHGPTARDTEVVIRGFHFAPTARASINTAALTGVEWVSSRELRATVPAGQEPGVYDVKVCNSDTLCGTLAGAYTVEPGGPVLQSVTPNRGYNDAPASIVLRGLDLSGNLAVTIGSTPVEDLTRVSSRLLHGVVPAGIAAGVYDVAAVDPSTSLSSTLASAYTVLDQTSTDLWAHQDDLWTDPPVVRSSSTVTVGLNVHRSGGVDPLAGVSVAFYAGAPQDGGTLLGSAQTPELAADSTQPVTVTWNTTGYTGTLSIYAVIDPENAVTETVESNNTVHRSVQIMPVDGHEPPDAPVVAIDSGELYTSNLQVDVAVSAAADDPSAADVNSLYLVERVYDAAAREWVRSSTTGWVAFQGTYRLTLSDQPGVHYIRAWLADKYGNVSPASEPVYINYLPAQAHVDQRGLHIYRQPLAAHETLTVTLTSLSGDADLSVWGSRGHRVAASNGTTGTDQVVVTAASATTYQVNVYGYQAADYQLVLTTGQAAASAAAPLQASVTASKPADTTPVTAEDVPSLAEAVPLPGSLAEVDLYLPAIRR